MKVYAVQLDIVWEAKAENRLRLASLLRAQAPQKGSLVVLPEMTCCGFTQQVEGLAEDPGGETEAFYAQLASELQITLVGGVIHKGQGGKGRNVAVAFSPEGRKLAQYCKIHPFTFSGETQFFEKGEELVTFSWGEAVVAPYICYDLRFPEIFRTLAGAELFLVIANWPAAREKHWMTLLQARAIENQAFVVGVNRCGSDPKNSYSGRSLMIDPQGAILVDAGSQECIIEADLDIAELRAYRERFPALSDRRELKISAKV